jgi:SOS-response transcriptional repressor LexA
MNENMRDIALKGQGDMSPSQFFIHEGIFPRMNDDVRERITKRLSETGKSPRAASLASGMSATAIRDIFRRPENSLTLETLKKLAVGLETTPEWLAFGTEDVGTFGWRPDQWKSLNVNAAKAESNHPSQSGAIPNSQTLLPIPVIGTVEAGAFREAPEYESDERHFIAAPPDREFPHAQRVCFDVSGDSMNDLKPRGLMHGDQVYGPAFHDIDNLVILRNDMVVVVEQTRDGGHTREWSVKQLEIYEDRYEFCPRSANKKHKPIIVPKKVFHDPSEDDGRQVRILALVRGVHSPIQF